MSGIKQRSGGKRDGAGRPTILNPRVTTSFTLETDALARLAAAAEATGQTRSAIVNRLIIDNL